LSALFICFFWVLPEGRTRQWLLTLASYLFYAAWDWRFCFLMLFWLRDYLYIRLGGNRAGRLATYRNLMITTLLGRYGTERPGTTWSGGCCMIRFVRAQTVVGGAGMPPRCHQLPERPVASNSHCAYPALGNARLAILSL